MHTGDVNPDSARLGWYVHIILIIIDGCRGGVNILKGRAGVQRDPGRLERKWTLSLERKERLRLDVRKSFFSLRTTQQRSSLPRDAAHSPYWSFSRYSWTKPWAARGLTSEVWTCCEQEVGLETSRASFWPQLIFDCNWKLQNCKRCLIAQGTSVKINRPTHPLVSKKFLTWTFSTFFLIVCSLLLKRDWIGIALPTMCYLGKCSLTNS